METFYLAIVVFIFIIAIFDLMVGVSNDAVNFLASAVGAKAASFRVIMVIAAFGIFIGASMSNGMMDIARHGIYQPQYFYMNEIMCILLAVMLTDVVLLDVFNSLGLPTSTTVSMVFELLGGTCAIAILKVAGDPSLALGNLINTDKALQVIIAIFTSVAIAFFFGVVVQYLARILFKFNYRRQLRYFGALFAGFAVTAIIYFIFFKGLKESALLTPSVREYMYSHTAMLLAICFAVSTVIMQILQWCKVNVLRIVVLSGTFALALAFAGNDLVNFIGVPLAGYSTYMDFVQNGAGASPDDFLMTSLAGSASTPLIFLVGAGVLMVITLFTSKKAQHVVKTSVDLSRQDMGQESFGTSLLARRLVRLSTNAISYVVNITPPKVRNWVASRFDTDDMVLENGAAFDLLRASVNLVLASLLIAVGTSLKLPLSTTYVTFMVAMGTSLADRAWGRETAVFRITGVVSVIGGWFITAGAAFLICFIVALSIFYGGTAAIVLLGVLAAYLLIRSQLQYKRKEKEAKRKDVLAQQMLDNKDSERALVLLRKYTEEEMSKLLLWSADTYDHMVRGFMGESYRMLRRTYNDIEDERIYFKDVKRLGTIGVSRLYDTDGLEKGLYFYQGMDFASDIIHAIKRICEPVLEHIDNNFTPLQEQARDSFLPVAGKSVDFMKKASDAIGEQREDLMHLYTEGNRLINQLAVLKREQIRQMREDTHYFKVNMVYLTLIQESQNVLATTINLLKINARFQDAGMRA